MSRHISAELRRLVASRANFRCEYCRLPEDFAIYPFEVDHIVAIKHGGQTREFNLAWCCLRCNRQKGTDLTTLLPYTDIPVRLFNPRTDIWHDHFEVQEGVIYGKTDTGEATAGLLAFNTPERIIGRQLLVQAGVYP